MISPGHKSLGSFNIAANATQVGGWVEGFEGALALATKLRLSYGSGGGVIKAYIQTSLDQGVTAMDIACVVFGAAGEVAAQNFSALTPKLTQVAPTDGTLADDTAIDGFLGDRFRVKVVSSSTVYAGSTVLYADAVAR